MKLLKILIVLMMIPVLAWGASSSDHTEPTSPEVDYGSGTSLDNFAQLSMAVWVKVEVNQDNADGVMGKNPKFLDITGGEAGCANTSSFRFGATRSDGFECWVAADNTVPVGVWKHIVATIDTNDTGDNALFYLDGVSVSVNKEVERAGTMGADADNNLLSPGADFEGQFNFPMYYNRELSALEASEIRWKPEMIPSGRFLLGAHWTGASPTDDLSGNGNTGTWAADVTTSTDGPPVMFGSGLPL